VVEDHSDTAWALETLLTNNGYQVAIATDGASAIVLGRNYSPQIVVCDIRLPGCIDGYRVAEVFRTTAWGRKARLVAFTGCALPKDKVKAIESGFDVHLSKPATGQQLLSTLDRLATNNS
jgi:CheY-like chemotaxis protein